MYSSSHAAEPQASSWQEGSVAPELSNNWKAASTWCEVNQGQLLLLGDVGRTPTWLCKPGHTTAGGTDSAGPSGSRFVRSACFSCTVLSVNVASCPSQTQGDVAALSHPLNSLPGSPRACVHQALPPLVFTALQPLAQHSLHNLYFGPQTGLSLSHLNQLDRLQFTLFDLPAKGKARTGVVIPRAKQRAWYTVGTQ